MRRENPSPIRICPQGHVHLEFGFTTVHLELEQFEALLKAGGEALKDYQFQRAFKALPRRSPVNEIH